MPDPGQGVEAQLAVLDASAGVAVSPADLPGIAVEHPAPMGKPDDAAAVRGRLRVARELLVEVSQPVRRRGTRKATTGEGGR